MKLPEPHVVDRVKVTGYLLSETHAVGRFKSRIFRALGFETSEPERFISELHESRAKGRSQ